MLSQRANRLLENALTEYLVDTYNQQDWGRLGTQTNTKDEIQGHDRLLRALSFGDDDYSTAVADVVPAVMRAFESEPRGPRTPGRLEYDLEWMSDVFPDLMEHFGRANPRMFRRFLDEAGDDLPAAWATADQAAVALPKQPAGRGSDLVDGWAIVGRATVAPPKQSVSHASGQESSKPSPTEGLPEGAGSGRSGDSEIDPDEVRVFLVHGRDEGTREIVRAYVRQITDINPTVLDNEINGGMTLIEKFERHAEASSVAIVLMTPDDQGSLVGEPLEPRARQNVIFELGYFIGRLGRQKVIALNDGVEPPSDIAGVLYIRYGDNWKETLRGELRAAGVPIVS